MLIPLYRARLVSSPTVRRASFLLSRDGRRVTDASLPQLVCELELSLPVRFFNSGKLARVMNVS